MVNCCFIYCKLSLQYLHLFLVLLLSVDATELVEFLFRNQMLCDQPFSDAQWVPVLDQCELDCKAEKEICMEDDQMKQTCRKLPEDCKKAFQEEQKKQTGNNIFNLLIEKTTLATTKSSQKISTEPKKTPKRRSKIATNTTKLLRRKERINLKKFKNENLINNTEAIISPINKEKQNNKNKKFSPRTIKTTKKRMLLKDGEMRKNKNLKMKGRKRRKLKEVEEQNKIKNKGEIQKRIIERLN